MSTALRLLATDDAGRVLLGQRAAGDRFPGSWEFFGGKKDDTDTDDRFALARELREETGLSLVGPLTEVDKREIVTPRGKTLTQITYAGQVEGTITLSDEHDDAAWHQTLPAKLTDTTAAILALVL